MKKILGLLCALMLLAICVAASADVYDDEPFMTGTVVDAAMHSLFIQADDGKEYGFAIEDDTDKSGLRDGILLGDKVVVTYTGTIDWAAQDTSNAHVVALATAYKPLDIDRVVSVEGEAETITTRRYEDGRGYSLWYNVNSMELLPFQDGDDTVRFVPKGEDIASDISLSIYESGVNGYTIEDVKNDLRAIVTADGLAPADADADECFPGLEAACVSGADENHATVAYGVLAPDCIHFLTVRYPIEAEEGFGARMRKTLKSFRLTDSYGFNAGTVYLPDDNAEHLIATKCALRDDPVGLLDALTEHKALSDYVKPLSFTIDGTHGALDVSDTLQTMLQQTGTAGETMILGSVVNTFLTNYGLETITITSGGGQTLETGHAIYDEPLAFKNP